MKGEVRVLGFDDGPFDKFKEVDCLVVGCVYRAGEYMDGLLSTRVKVDGSDSTRKLASCINKSKFKGDLKFILMKGLAFGGFNIVDIRKLYEQTGIPVVVVMRSYPRYSLFFRALDKLGLSRRKRLVERAGEPVEVGGLFVQFAGAALPEVRKLLRLTCTRSNIPEPLRVAHIIASGIVTGESRGQA